MSKQQSTDDILRASEAGNVDEVKRILLAAAGAVNEGLLLAGVDKANDQGHTDVVEALKQWINDAATSRTWWDICSNSCDSSRRSSAVRFTLDDSFDDPHTFDSLKFWEATLQSPVESRSIEDEDVVLQCKNGIPPQLRGRAWLWLAWPIIKQVHRQRCSRLSLSAICHPTPMFEADLMSYFHSLLATEESTISPAVRDIEKDLDRSGLDSDDSAGMSALRRVLVAFAQFNRGGDVGYCQGLNFVAVELLSVMQNEAHAFWLLAVIIEGLCPQMYTATMLGVHVVSGTCRTCLSTRFYPSH
jgi:hypothetical protein